MKNHLQYFLLLVLYTITGGQSQGLTVNIITDPASEPYPAADWIRFSCHVTANASMVMYDWILLCSRQQPPLIVITYENHTSVSQFDLSVRSTPSICLDTVMCNATDQSGNSGHATWRIGRVTGAGLWGTSTFLYNTSSFRADASGDIGIIYCHSSSNSSNVGRWISPQGLDITRNFTDPFSIQFDNGPDYPSYNTFQLLSPSSQPFTSTYNGVYSCIVPDDQGIMQTLHIGIYSHEYSGVLMFQLDRLGRSSESPITLNCPTTGLLPFDTYWEKSGMNLVNSGTYEITTRLRDRQTATFDNFLRIYQTFQQAEGIYRCIPASSMDGPIQDRNITRITSYFFAMYSVGHSSSITCTLSRVSIYAWYDEDGSRVVSGNVLSYSANDSIHHKIFMCFGQNTTTLDTRALYIKFIINVPPEALEVTAMSDDAAPILGQSYSMDCTGHKTVSGLANQPLPQWFTPSGALLSSSNDIQLQGPRNVGLSSSELVVQFPTLRTSHAGNYTCQASLSSPALTSPIVKTAIFAVTVQIPSPTVTLTVLSSELQHVVGGTFSLQCQTTVSHHVNTPATVNFTWRRTSGIISSSLSPRITISDTTAVFNQSYSSILTITNLSTMTDSLMNYSCEAVVRSDPVSSYISTSMSASSNTYTLNVQAVGLTVSISPAQISVIDVSPSNSFTLTCTATSASNSMATKVFTWYKQALGSGLSMELVHNGGSIVIATFGDTSTLTASETQSGGYVYNCSARIGDGDPSSDTAIVNVLGPRLPLPATTIVSTVTSFSTATISWSVSRVAYTPESYAVAFGTNQTNLNQRSASISGVTGVNQYSTVLTQLEHATVYYFQVESTNTIGSTRSEMRSFEVQNASVIISITGSDNSPAAGSNFTLTCSAVELVDHSGDTVVTWLDVEGQNITSGGDFTITRQNMNQKVDYGLQFNPLRVSHGGLYTCAVSIPNVGYHDSKNFSVQVTRGNLGVTIQANGTSQVGTYHSLSCLVGTGPTSPIGTVTYEWTSTCSGDCFVLGQSTTATVNTQYLKAVDSGTHTCTVTDSIGNQGSASAQISTSGVGIYHSSAGLLTNNSVIRADNGYLQGSLFCLSGRGEAEIGQWIAPNGDDYTLPGTHAFEVSVGGQNNPGVVEISVSGSDNRFPAGQWDGMYSCVIPDETGTEQRIYLGIYLVFGSPPPPVIQSLTASSLGLYSYFTLNCSSGVSAATEVAWTLDSQTISVDGQTYASFQILRDGTTSSYDNLLIILSGNVNDFSGQYGCTVTNQFGRGTQRVNFRGIEVSEHGAFALGSEVSITCSSDLGVRSINWLHDGQDVSSTEGSIGELRIPTVTENDHGSQYTCQSNAPFGTQEHNITIQVEVDPESALSALATTSPTSPQEGKNFTLTCVVRRSSYLRSIPSVDWYDAMGNRIVTDGGIRVGLLVESGDGTVMKSLTFASLDTSHSMEYRCNATLRFRPPPYIISKEAVWDLLVQSTSNPLATDPTSATVTSDNNGISGETKQSQQSELLFVGAGVGGGVLIVVIFIMIILVYMCWKRSQKIKQRQQEASNVLYNNSFAMGTEVSNVAYGMTQGVFTGGPGATGSMIPLTKSHVAPDLPPWNNHPYNITPRNVMATPNAYAFEHSDTYTFMNPAGSAFVPKVPPPQYEESSSFKKDFDDQLYSEIPGEYLTLQNGEENQSQPQYGNVPSSEIKLQLHPGDTEKEDLSTTSDTPVQEVYDN